MPTTQRVRHELSFRLLEVREVQQLSPEMVRITLTGDLSRFASAGPDDHVKLFFPAPGEDRPALPEVVDGAIAWPADRARPEARDYTPRRFDVEAGELVVDFVVHGDGPGGSWAASAQPGALLGQGGPRGSLVVSDDFDWYLLAGDEAALPAIGRRLEELPAGARAIVIAEVAGPASEIALATEADAQITWLHRDGARAGTTGALEAALRELTLPDGEGFAWVGAEADEARAIRRLLRDERGLAKDRTRITGYWKRGTANHHDAPDA